MFLGNGKLALCINRLIRTLRSLGIEVYLAHMPEESSSVDEKVRKLQEAYDAFVAQLRGLEHERLEVMKRVIGDLEQEEIQRVLNELKQN